MYKVIYKCSEKVRKILDSSVWIEYFGGSDKIKNKYSL